MMGANSSKIAWNTLMQVGGKIASTSVGVLITILLTRFLGPAGFGDYTFVTVFVLMFGAIADWGLSLIGISEASKDIKKQGTVIGNVLLIRLVLAIVAMVAANLVVRILPHSPSLEYLILIGSVFIFIFSLKSSLQIVFYAQLKMQFWAVSEITANIVGLVAVWLLVSFNSPLPGFIWAMSLGQVVAAAVAAIFAARLVRLNFKLDREIVRRVLKEALPVGALLVVFTVYNRIDIVMLGYFQGAEVVGFYGVSYRVYEVMVLGGAYFANSILPILSAKAHNDQAGFRRVFIKSYVVLFFLGLGVAIANFILAPLAVAVIAGGEYGPSVFALQLLSLATFIAYFNHLNGYAIIALSKQWYSFVIAICVLVINIGLNFILIPRFSLFGAAINTFLTELLVVVLSLIVLRKVAGVRFGLQDILREGRELVLEKDKVIRLVKAKVKWL